MKIARFVLRVVVPASLLILLGLSAIPAMASVLPRPPL